jgi:hypothetical protein
MTAPIPSHSTPESSNTPNALVMMVVLFRGLANACERPNNSGAKLGYFCIWRICSPIASTFEISKLDMFPW